MHILGELHGDVLGVNAGDGTLTLATPAAERDTFVVHRVHASDAIETLSFGYDSSGATFYGFDWTSTVVDDTTGYWLSAISIEGSGDVRPRVMGLYCHE